jgi:hypothetical protein
MFRKLFQTPTKQMQGRCRLASTKPQTKSQSGLAACRNRVQQLVAARHRLTYSALPAYRILLHYSERSLFRSAIIVVSQAERLPDIHTVNVQATLPISRACGSSFHRPPVQNHFVHPCSFPLALHSPVVDFCHILTRQHSTRSLSPFAAPILIYTVGVASW